MLLLPHVLVVFLVILLFLPVSWGTKFTLGGIVLVPSVAWLSIPIIDGWLTRRKVLRHLPLGSTRVAVHSFLESDGKRHGWREQSFVAGGPGADEMWAKAACEPHTLQESFTIKFRFDQDERLVSVKVTGELTMP